jgi:hypothetical protein
MQRLKRKLYDSKEENKSQENPAKVVAGLPIITIVLVKLQIYTIRLLSFLPSKRYLPVGLMTRCFLVQMLCVLHKMATIMQVQQLVPCDGSEDSPYMIVSDEPSSKPSQPKMTMPEELKPPCTDSGLLDWTDISALDELTEEEKHLKRLLDFVDNETI